MRESEEVKKVLSGALCNGLSLVWKERHRMEVLLGDPSDYEKYVKLVNDRNGVVMVSTGRELWKWRNHVVSNAVNYCRSLLKVGLDSSRILVLYNANSSRLNLPKFAKETGAYVPMHPFRHFEVDTVARHRVPKLVNNTVGNRFLWDDNNNQRLNNTLLPSNKNQVRAKYLGLFGKPGKIHRAAMILELAKRDLVKDSLLSCLVDKEGVKDLIRQLSSNLSPRYETRLWETFYDIKGSPDGARIDRPFDSTGSNYEGFPYDHRLYRDTLVSLIGETEIDENAGNFYSDDGYYVTEKTTRAIYNYHPFVLVGSPYFLSGLRNLGGYETFREIIDESYDGLVNAVDRSVSAIDAAEELVKNARDPRVTDIVTHNRYTLEETYTRELNRLLNQLRDMLRK